MEKGVTGKTWFELLQEERKKAYKSAEEKRKWKDLLSSNVFRSKSITKEEFDKLNSQEKDEFLRIIFHDKKLASVSRLINTSKNKDIISKIMKLREIIKLGREMGIETTCCNIGFETYVELLLLGCDDDGIR